MNFKDTMTIAVAEAIIEGRDVAWLTYSNGHQVIRP